MTQFEIEIPTDRSLEVADVAVALLFQGHLTADPVAVYQQIMREEEANRNG